MNHRPGPQSDDFLRRLRAWPVSSWRHGDRIAATRRALDVLAALAATARGAAAPEVPPLAAHVLADQLVVLIADADAAGVPAADVDAVITVLRTELGLG
jgi:hypothetical protein